MTIEFISDILLIGLIGGGLHLDRTAAFQFLVSRPIVASVIAGSVLGEPMVGLGSGLVLELLWLGIHPLGTSIPPDDTVVSVAVPAGVILADRLTGQILGPDPAAVLALAILMALPLAAVGRWMDIGLRVLNGRFLKAAREGIKAGDHRVIGRQVAKSILAIFSAFTVLTIVGACILSALISILYPFLDQRFILALKLVYFTTPFFGAAGMLTRLRESGRFRLSAAFLATYAILFIAVRCVL
ncbi:MAG: PTS sugar transporter subunit IIC [Deltaproteobacteria bacterium]|uniref:PTS sugar transporter subunit IIC n=1 Tax=Candidatus Zymogenus saltonus TaxID=2844893 RepID=A0A9D8KI93_9DELT|nr:PTS sugar transporter subunit IIC [Candidatus Zymogenus saltonus]